MMYRPTRAVLSEKALLHNVARLRRRIGLSKMVAMDEGQ